MRFRSPSRSGSKQGKQLSGQRVVGRCRSPDIYRRQGSMRDTFLSTPRIGQTGGSMAFLMELYCENVRRRANIWEENRAGKATRDCLRHRGVTRHAALKCAPHSSLKPERTCKNAAIAQADLQMHPQHRDKCALWTRKSYSLGSCVGNRCVRDCVSGCRRIAPKYRRRDAGVVSRPARPSTTNWYVVFRATAGPM